MTAALAPVRRHDIRWFAPAPLWAGQLDADLAAFNRPALLRLESDAFMDDLTAALAAGPAALAALVATPLSYRAAPPGMPGDHTVPIDHVKLFQPVHGHFNLVAASLACRTVGLPDRGVDAATEITAFVVRRVEQGREFAWTPAGWTPASPTLLAPDERPSPLFPVPYATGGTGPALRRLHVGLIPTASAETGRSAALPAPDGPAPPDGRPDELVARVVEPLSALTAMAARMPPEQRAEVSRFVLLDLAAFLEQHAPALWEAVLQERRPADGTAARAYDLLADKVAEEPLTWQAALAAVWAERERICAGTGPLTAVDLAGGAMPPGLLRSRVVAALPAAPPPPAGPAPGRFDPRPEVRYVVRCAYLRPRCGPRHPALLSEPSAPFAIAPYFDTDAPARPIRIPLPVDVSLAGLRGAPRNVTVLISRELRAQMSRVKEMKKAIDGTVDDAEPVELGQICSFSLPIITICALILLLMIVAVLNIAFFWLPLFRICLPIPLKGRA